MVTALKDYKIDGDEVSELHILLHGPVGAGKSSIINTIKSIFENRQFVNCLAATASGTSHTLDYQKYTVKSGHSGHLPFAFYDVMGLEKLQSNGVHTDDIINALKGHIQNGYKFKHDHQISEDSKYYIRNPSLNDKMHCLVSVVAADKISFMDKEVISKMRLIRKEASELGIPQVVFMTRVDEACVLTKNDLNKIYQSKIKDKMHECSNTLGVPLNCIFRVKNYHDEIDLNDSVNCLMLEALTQIVLWADDYVKKCSEK